MRSAIDQTNIHDITFTLEQQVDSRTLLAPRLELTALPCIHCTPPLSAVTRRTPQLDVGHVV